MLEKLIENWLDSASERSYQAIFCQMLANNGYTVVHSSRHAPIEQGKDIIALDPKGIPCAFQLKGNPGSRLTLKQYRDIQGQIFQLINQAIEHPSIANAKSHRSFLVTNGYIEEEAQQAINQLNKKNKQDGYPKRKLETITRDQMLAWARDLEFSLWPSELSDIRALLEIFMSDGGDLFPVEKLHRLLGLLLNLRAESASLKETEFDRHASSTALLISVVLTPFSVSKNHWAVATAWTVFSAYLIAAASKHKVQDKQIEPLLNLAADEIFSSIYMLLDEALERKGSLADGDPRTDYVAYKWRCTLLLGIGSYFYLWAGERITPEFKDKLSEFLNLNLETLDVWGEGVFPQLMTYAWYLEKSGKSAQLRQLIQFLGSAIFNDKLLNVYQPFEEAVRHRLSEYLEDFKPLNSMKFSEKNSWIVKSFFECCVAMDLREDCKSFWRDYSKSFPCEFIPGKAYAYCIWHSSSGTNLNYTLPDRASWDDLRAQIAERKAPKAPKLLLNRPHLFWLWCIIAPHRATSEVSSYIFSKIPVSSSPPETRSVDATPNPSPSRRRAAKKPGSRKQSAPVRKRAKK